MTCTTNLISENVTDFQLDLIESDALMNLVHCFPDMLLPYRAHRSLIHQ